jgi:hypothetical protein
VDESHELAVQTVNLQLISKHKSFGVDRSLGMVLLVGSSGKSVLVAEVGTILLSAAAAKPASSASCLIGAGAWIVNLVSWYRYRC